MKKLQAATLVIILAALVFVLVTCFPNNRTEDALVMGVTGDTVTVMTFSDENVWTFDGDGYHVGDIVELTIYDRDTAAKSDDIIMDVKTL